MSRKGTYSEKERGRESKKEREGGMTHLGLIGQEGHVNLLQGFDDASNPGLPNLTEEIIWTNYTHTHTHTHTH